MRRGIKVLKVIIWGVSLRFESLIKEDLRHCKSYRIKSTECSPVRAWIKSELGMLKKMEEMFMSARV